jgi:hypothetical protein
MFKQLASSRPLATVVALLAVFVFAGAFLSPARADLIAGSEGAVTLVGNDTANNTGSFVVDIVWEVYDGSSASDPGGITGTDQIAFVLHHTGGDGETPVLNVGRFTVFAPEPASTTVAYYDSGSAIDPPSNTILIGPSGSELDPSGGRAPSNINIDPPPDGTNRAKFYFQDGLQSPLLASGEHSQLLVLTLASGSELPADVVVELNGTDSVPQVHADTTIHLVPEPGTMLLISVGTLMLSRRRRRRSV